MNSNLTQGVSRRSFMRILGAASAAATTLPAFAGIQQPATQAPSASGRRDGMRGMQLSPDTVIISSNENPLGPAQCALTAICSTATLGGRYHFDEYVKTVAVFNEQFGLKKDYSALFPGSGGPLDLALMSNIGPDKPLVYGDPSYEQGPRAADTMKAPKYPVPLTATYAHDVKAMVKAHPSPGAYYIVNPNNTVGVQPVQVVTGNDKVSAVTGVDTAVTVATSGFDRLENGAHVQVHESKPKSPSTRMGPSTGGSTTP